MPIIQICALPPSGDLEVPAALARVTTAVSTYLREDPSGTWALWRPVAPGAYAEGSDTPVTQPEATHPAIVDVYAGPREDPAELLQVVGRAVVDAFGLTEGNVVVRLTEADPARVYWGE
jgi:phenylpyruvate tautomerase PptA (4-oxalocrotonate tautomerase family)